MDVNMWNSLQKAFTLMSYLIIAYFIQKALKPIFSLLHKIYHYHGFHCLPRSFIFGHLKLLCPGFPFSGNIKDISKNIPIFFDKTISTNKDRSFSTMWLGPFPVLIVSDHTAVEAVMTKTNLQKPFWYRFIGLADGLVTSDPMLWKIRRRAIEPFFVTKRQRHFVKYMNQEISTMPDKLKDQIGKPVDIENLIHKSTLDVIVRVVGSVPLNEMEKEKEKLLDTLTSCEAIFMRRAMTPLFWFDSIVSLFETGKSYFQNLQNLDTIINTFFDHRKKLMTLSPPNKPEDYDLVHLLEKQTEKTGVRDEVLTTIAAGHETVAVSLRWTLFSLGHHLEIQERLYREIIEHFPDTPTDDLDAINGCIYLDQFIKESLRMNPPIHFIGRVLDEDVIVNGTKIFKGTSTLVCIPSTHRDPTIYPEPDKFDPDRWTPENAAKIPKSAYIPFGYGPRNCIGYRYAMTELKVYLIHVLRNFSIKSTRNPESIPLKSEVSLKPALPLEIVLTPRSNNNQEFLDIFK